MALEVQRKELTRLGFDIVKDAGDSLVAVRQKWHWDCALTKLTWVVFLRRVGELTEGDLEADRPRWEAEARRVDPSWWPNGLQKGILALPVYFADRVTPGARAICERGPLRRLSGVHSYPAALELATGQAAYLTSTPLWGGFYHEKVRHVLRRLFDPGREPAPEPVSAGGLALGVVLLGCLALPLVALLVVG